MTQQGDVALYHTTDDGEITVVNGLVTMSSGLETSVYLSLFGGNEDDAGQENSVENWWGNLDEIDPAKQYRSETQNLLQALTATSANLRKIEAAAGRDLAWMVPNGAASEVTAEASIPGLNKLKLVVAIIAAGEEQSFTFIENWKYEI